MMRPKSVKENMDNFNSVTSDLVDRIKTLAANNKLERKVNDVKRHLFDWSTECEYFPEQETRVFMLYLVNREKRTK